MPADSDITLDPGLVRSYADDQMPGLEGLREINKIMPMVPIAIRDWKVEQILENYAVNDGAGLVRPDGAAPVEVDWTQTSTSGQAIEYACQVRISDRAVEEARNAGDPDKWLRRSLAFIKRKLLMAKNADVNTLISTAANWGSETTDVSAGNQWDNAVAGTPLTDLRLEIANFSERRGMPRGKLILAARPLVLHYILDHPQTKADFGGGFAGVTTTGTMEQLAGKLGIRAVIELGGSYNSANVGQTATIVNQFDKDAWLLELPAGSEVSGVMPLDGETGAYGAQFVLDPRIMQETGEGAVDNVDEDFIVYETIDRNSDLGKMHGSRFIIGRSTWDSAILNNQAGHQFADAIA